MPQPEPPPQPARDLIEQAPQIGKRGCLVGPHVIERLNQRNLILSIALRLLLKLGNELALYSSVDRCASSVPRCASSSMRSASTSKERTRQRWRWRMISSHIESITLREVHETVPNLLGTVSFAISFFSF
jgi:hypothetical protein